MVSGTLVAVQTTSLLVLTILLQIGHTAMDLDAGKSKSYLSTLGDLILREYKPFVPLSLSELLSCHVGLLVSLGSK
jgi:hypothetical protein